MSGMSGFERLGRLLFRWRGPIGFLGYVLVFWLGRPTPVTCLAGIPLLLAGEGLRVWSMGYIGPAARDGEIGADRYIGSGPFRWFRLDARSPAGHPLYFGNLLLVLGMLVVLWPPVPLAGLVVVVFLVEYRLMARIEERDLIRRFGGRATHAVGFDARRALCEWRTGVVLAVAYGLAVLRAALGGG